jgi:phenylalanine-4-hydroxylase
MRITLKVDRISRITLKMDRITRITMKMDRIMRIAFEIDRLESLLDNELYASREQMHEDHALVAVMNVNNINLA